MGQKYQPDDVTEFSITRNWRCLAEHICLYYAFSRSWINLKKPSFHQGKGSNPCLMHIIANVLPGGLA